MKLETYVLKDIPVMKDKLLQIQNILGHRDKIRRLTSMLMSDRVGFLEYTYIPNMEAVTGSEKSDTEKKSIIMLPKQPTVTFLSHFHSHSVLLRHSYWKLKKETHSNAFIFTFFVKYLFLCLMFPTNI